MPHIEPSVGRVVWYYPAADDARLKRDKAGPLAAMIAMVRPDGMLNLMVVAQDGHPVGRVGVQLVQDTSSADINVVAGYATWMPYQRAVAAGQIAPTLHANEKM